MSFPTYAEVRRAKGGFAKGLYELAKDNSEAISNLDTVDLAAVEQAVSTLEGTDIPALENAVELIPAVIFCQAYIPADSAAGDTWVRPIGVVPESATPIKVMVVPNSDIGQATDYMTLTVTEMNTDEVNKGTPKQIVGEVDINSTHVIDSDTGMDIILAEVGDLVAGNILTLEKEVAGDGQAWPGGLVVVQYTIPTAP